MSIEKQLKESVRHSHILDNRLQDRQFEVQRLTAILTNLQNITQESSDRYEQKIVRLQEQLTETEKQLDTARDNSERHKREIIQLEQKITQLQEQSIETEKQLNTARDNSDCHKQEIIQLQERLTEKEQLIAAMMTSKFWKIRSIWFKIKNNLGIKDE